MPVLTVAVLVFDGVDQLDVAGPFEVFGVAGELLSAPGAADRFEAAGDGLPVPRPELVGVHPGPVRTRHGMILEPETDLSRPVAPDWVVVPGGDGSRPLVHDERLLGWLRARIGRSRRVMSVCTGARVLAAAGLLDGRPFTTHASAVAELVTRTPTGRLHRGARWTRDDPVWCSAGVTAGIDMSLAAVADHAGLDVATAVADVIEFPWPRPGAGTEPG